MTDLEKYVSMLHNAQIEYFYYHDRNREVIVEYVDGVAVLHCFDSDSKQYVNSNVMSGYDSLAEVIDKE